jgi:hypothetical protein
MARRKFEEPGVCPEDTFPANGSSSISWCLYAPRVGRRAIVHAIAFSASFQFLDAKIAKSNLARLRLLADGVDLQGDEAGRR